ncbi:bacteriocin immunity protein [Lacticaseibacillus sharpeae]|nr:bacteriocin immunity protein [Lacticaseibacillus sharpeae]
MTQLNADNLAVRVHALLADDAVPTNEREMLAAAEAELAKGTNTDRVVRKLSSQLGGLAMQQKLSKHTLSFFNELGQVQTGVSKRGTGLSQLGI